jgi:hypothetical protein
MPGQEGDEVKINDRQAFSIDFHDGAPAAILTPAAIV